MEPFLSEQCEQSDSESVTEIGDASRGSTVEPVGSYSQAPKSDFFERLVLI
jgi:hypothetical protein